MEEKSQNLTIAFPPFTSERAASHGLCTLLTVMKTGYCADSTLTPTSPIAPQLSAMSSSREPAPQAP